MSFSIRKYYTKSTKRIVTSLNFMRRDRTSPNVKKHLQCSPHNVYKVPVENGKVKCNSFGRCSTRQKGITHRKVDSPYKDVESVESSGEVKRTPVDSVRECKTCGCILYILAIHEKRSLSDGNQ
jgi:hypothetical protein